MALHGNDSLSHMAASWDSIPDMQQVTEVVAKIILKNIPWPVSGVIPSHA